MRSRAGIPTARSITLALRGLVALVAAATTSHATLWAIGPRSTDASAIRDDLLDASVVALCAAIAALLATRAAPATWTLRAPPMIGLVAAVRVIVHVAPG